MLGRRSSPRCPWHERHAHPRPDRRRPRGRPERPAQGARVRSGHRGRRRGGRCQARRLRDAGPEARRDPDGRRHAGEERYRGDSRGPSGRSRGQGPGPLDAGRSRTTCARPSPPVPPDTSSRRLPTPTSSLPCAKSPVAAITSTPPRRPHGRRRRRGAKASRRRPAFRPRARCPTAARARPHEPGDRGELYISVRTAETHRAHIMQKLRLSTRAELVRYALEHGLLEVEDDT